MDIQYYLTQAVQENASDLHITVGEPPILRIDGELMPVGEVRLSPADTLELTKQATADVLPNWSVRANWTFPWV
jgi:twitching motility protein PilT